MTQKLGGLFLALEGLEGLLAMSRAVEEVVVHAGHHAVLVQDVRDAAVNGAKYGALHFPLLANLAVNNSRSTKWETRCETTRHDLQTALETAACVFRPFSREITAVG